MQTFIIFASDRRKYLVISESEHEAKIKFSQNLPDLKIKSISETNETVFNIIE